jgi:tetratricopeptide (TPR) repeat protein
MTPRVRTQAIDTLRGKRLWFAGKLASMSKRDASALVREHGAVVAEGLESLVDVIVVGEDGLPLALGSGQDEWFDMAIQQAVDRGDVEVVTETQLWQRLGLVEAESEIHRLYTPAMLAELAAVPVAVVRRWHRRGLIRPVREVRKLAYFDFQEVTTARRLAELLAAGMSPRAIEKKLERLSRLLPDVKRPLAQLSVIVEGKEILLRQGDGLIDPGGQLRFDFEAAQPDGHPGRRTRSDEPESSAVLSLAEQSSGADPAKSPDALCRMAEALEEAGDLARAAEMYRAALAAAGPSAEICFEVAELLYRLGDLSGARERYYVAVELDEDYVEARANLGCVLAESGELELAVAAFHGALAYHEDYADVHYHLGRILEELGRADETEVHWQAFLDLAPESPWAEEARRHLALRSSD